MKSKLKPCPACGSQIAKGATSCPQCGKTFTSAAGIVLAVLIGLAVGWLMMARHCSQAAEADRQLEEIREKMQPGQ